MGIAFNINALFWFDGNLFAFDMHADVMVFQVQGYSSLAERKLDGILTQVL